MLAICAPGSAHWPSLLNSSQVFHRCSPGFRPWAIVICDIYFTNCNYYLLFPGANDTQLFIVLNPSNPSSDIANLTTCLHALQSWFCVNGMALNPDKSDAILLGTRQCSRTFASVRSVDVVGCSVLLFNSIKILGVTLDCHLSLDKHISSICKSAYYHIRSLRHIRWPSLMIWPNQSLLLWSALA